MTKSGLSSPMNMALLLIVALLIGAIGGFLVGRAMLTPLPPAQVAAQPALNQLNDVLSAENVWIVEGFSCPMPDCHNPLATCQGELPRRIRDWINSQLASGRSGKDLREEVIRTHGQALYKLPLK
ncbi:MAG: hypothetical protein HY304_05370 [candidate division Zixibacteria bacterium]|nr:hypothetical protein [candidate division Zixibacteria bacterium]